MMRLLTLACVLLLAFDGSAAPIRQPHDRPDEPEPLPPIALDQLPKKDVAAFGNWVVAQTSHEHGILVIHRQSRMGIYLAWAANSWVNYRSVDGVSYMLNPFPSTDVGRMERDYEINRLFSKPTQTRVAPGTHKFGQWTVTVTPDRIDFNCTALQGCRMSVRSDANTFTFNDREIGGAK
jgi:hypothetical protein